MTPALCGFTSYDLDLWPFPLKNGTPLTRALFVFGNRELEVLNLGNRFIILSFYWGRGAEA